MHLNTILALICVILAVGFLTVFWLLNRMTIEKQKDSIELRESLNRNEILCLSLTKELVRVASPKIISRARGGKHRVISHSDAELVRMEKKNVT